MKDMPGRITLWIYSADEWTPSAMKMFAWEVSILAPAFEQFTVDYWGA